MLKLNSYPAERALWVTGDLVEIIILYDTANEHFSIGKLQNVTYYSTVNHELLKIKLF